MAGNEDTIDKRGKCVEDAFGKCILNQDTCTNCAVGYTKGDDGNVTLDQDEDIKQPRPMQHPELTGADSDAQVSKMVADMLVSLRGALAYALKHPGVVDGACCISTTFPRTDQHPSATTERDRQEAEGLPREDRLPGDDPYGRG
eukprot:9472291-Pyramimonas_sp.AAC.1